VKVFFALLFIAAILSLVLRRSFIKVYAKAQFALQETLSKTSPAQSLATVPFLREAHLERVTIGSKSLAVGKRVRELQLRSETGASIVGIERNGVSLINPGPDEELQTGDQVSLLGTRAQLASAKAALENGPGSPDIPPAGSH
jgi:CPA2 family monovalent cation:H+ antiporter-2